MAQQEDGQYPRINAAMLHSRQFGGKIVSLVGCVESFDGTTVSLKCADNATIPVNAAETDFNHPTGTFVELVGFVNEDNTVSVSIIMIIVCLCDVILVQHCLLLVTHTLLSLTFSHYTTALCHSRTL